MMIHNLPTDRHHRIDLADSVLRVASFSIVGLPRWRVYAVLVATFFLSHSARSQQLPQTFSSEPRIEFVAPLVKLPVELRDSIRFGFLEVPQDHDRLQGRTLRLAIAILTARTSQPAPDPLVLIPGGPGAAEIRDSAVRFARSSRIGQFRNRRDFIIMEPRGHGFSEPRLCSTLEAPLVEDSEEAEAIFATRMRECRSRLSAEDIRLEALSSVQAARDIELLRKALHAPAVNLIGGSYGARIAAEAMRQVPSALRSVNLVSPVPAGLSSLGDEDTVAVNMMNLFVRRCSEEPTCHAAYPQLKNDYDSLLARLQRAPLIVAVQRSDRLPEGEIRLDEKILRDGLAQLLSTPDLAAGIPLLIHQLAHQGLAIARKMAPLMLNLLEEEVSVGTQHAFWCNDSTVTLETTRWLHPRCRTWIGETYGDTLGERVRSAIPTLIQVGEFDTRTPPSYARFAAEGLSNAYIAEIPWGGHGLRDDCSFKIAREFFDTPMRAPDTTCLDALPPITFVAGIVPSRWTGSVVMSAYAHPFTMAGAAFTALALLLAGLTVLPWHYLRGRRTPSAGTIIFWLAIGTALTLLVGFVVATLIGAHRHVFVPMLGLPEGWGWLLNLPWLLLMLVSLSAGLAAWRTSSSGRSPLIATLSAVTGIGIVLGLWLFHSLV